MRQFINTKIYLQLLLLLLPWSLLQSVATAQTARIKEICVQCEGGGGGGTGLPAITCTGARDTVYVDATTGNNAHDGRTWATAVATLQRGLAMANECESVFTILVAKGTYTASTTSGTLAARD